MKNIGSTMGALYLDMLDARPDLFAAALGSMAEADPGAVLVHCAAGKDRTGLVVALALSVAGADPETVAADYARHRRAAGAVRREVPGHDRRRAACASSGAATRRRRSTFMLDVLDHLENEHGGVEAYLRSGGMTDEQLTALRERLVA